MSREVQQLVEAISFKLELMETVFFFNERSGCKLNSAIKRSQQTNCNLTSSACMSQAIESSEQRTDHRAMPMDRKKLARNPK
jgi:hypothetical protein